MLKFIHLPEVGSTNDEAPRLLLSTDAHAVAVSADVQTEGRGQRGSSWSSAPGENLTFSLAFRPKIEVAAHFRLNMAVCLGILDFLDSLGLRAEVKWPNDIFANHHKLAGVLIENTLRGSRIEQSVVGIGLNLNQQNFGIRGARPISVAQLTGRQYDHGTMLVQCANAVWNRLLALQHTEMQAYLARLYRYGTTAIFAANGKTFEGTIVGVADDGMLQLKMPDGRLQQFAFKEIEYIFENL